MNVVWVFRGVFSVALSVDVDVVEVVLFEVLVVEVEDCGRDWIPRFWAAGVWVRKAKGGCCCSPSLPVSAGLVFVFSKVEPDDVEIRGSGL